MIGYALKAKLAPYKTGIYAAIVAVIFLSGMVTGCRVQASRDAAKLEAKAHELMVCQFDRGTLAEALNEVNAKAEAAKEVAKVQAKAADDAVKQAARERKAYEARLSEVDRALVKAKRSPTCRAQLEAELCVSLD